MIKNVRVIRGGRIASDVQDVFVCDDLAFETCPASSHNGEQSFGVFFSAEGLFDSNKILCASGLTPRLALVFCFYDFVEKEGHDRYSRAQVLPVWS